MSSPRALLALVALSLFINAGEGFYFNKDSFAEAINKEFLQKHPNAVRNVQHMFPNIDKNRIFNLKKVCSVTYKIDFENLELFSCFQKIGKSIPIMSWEQRAALKDLLFGFQSSKDPTQIRLKILTHPHEPTELPLSQFRFMQQSPFSPFGGK